jgi:hypothetical protein
MPTVFSTLNTLMPVLDAASKYDMKGVIGAISIQLISRMSTDGMTGDALLYKDPLWVYAKAKHLGLDKVANAAANATLGIDITNQPKDNPDVANMPASWLWDLLELRKARRRWFSNKGCGQFPIGNLKADYTVGQPSESVYFPLFSCRCLQQTANSQYKVLSTSQVEWITTNPCPKWVRSLDFNRQWNCFRCGRLHPCFLRKSVVIMKRSLASSDEIRRIVYILRGYTRVLALCSLFVFILRFVRERCSV